MIVAKREVQRLPYFDFEDVGIARKLAQLWKQAAASTQSIGS